MAVQTHPKGVAWHVEFKPKIGIILAVVVGTAFWCEKTVWCLTHPSGEFGRPSELTRRGWYGILISNGKVVILHPVSLALRTTSPGPAAAAVVHRPFSAASAPHGLGFCLPRP